MFRIFRKSKSTENNATSERFNRVELIPAIKNTPADVEITQKQPIGLAQVFGCGRHIWSEIDRTNLSAFSKSASLFQRRGMIVSLWGPSKIGKTTLARQVYSSRKLVEVHGQHAKTIEQFFETLRVALHAPEKTIMTSSGAQEYADQVHAKGTVSVDGFGMKAGIGGGGNKRCARTVSTTMRHEYGLRTPLELIQKLVDLDAVLMIDDAHAIPPDVQADILRHMRDFLSNSGTVCLVSVPDCLTRVLATDHELAALTCMIEAPPWSSKELARICRKGFYALGLQVPDPAIRTLVRSCNYNPLLLQILCLNLCRQYEIVEVQHPHRLLAPSTTQLRKVVRSTAEERPRPAYVEIATSADESWKLKSGRPASIYALILLGVRHIGFQQEIGAGRLTERIAELVGQAGPKPTLSVVTRALNRFSNELTRRLEHNSPLVFDTMTRRVYFLDPFLLMHLQWVFAPALGESEPPIL